MLSELARYGFVNLSETVGKLDQLVSLVGDNGRSALAHLAQAADADQALSKLLQLAELDRVRVKKLLAKSDSAIRLCQVLGASSALADFLIRKPELLALLEKPVTRLKSSVQLRDQLKSVTSDALELPIANAWSALRYAYRVELLEIAIYDLGQQNQENGLPAVAAALADLAAAALEAAIECAKFELTNSTEHGVFEKEEIRNTRFAVIAMGKCGARELNYISDVDVIFVAESASAQLETARAIDIATRLATRMMRAIDATANEPMLWQVDPNLRPEGKSGALVRSLESHVSYYDRWAKSWEFQALLKARPIAGDMELGQAYITALAPRVWASAGRDGFVESAQKMRELVTSNIPEAEIEAQIKLGPGGLRDIEFTVQLLQLVHGRTDETLRHRDTISAIAALSDGGYIGRTDAESFSAHYRFLRLLEHRIQLSQMRRTHLMPDDEAKRRSLARAVGLSSADALMSKWVAVKAEVRGLHQRIFYRPLLTSVAKLGDSGLEISAAQAQDRLAAIGFVDTKGALGHIAALTSGLSRRAAIQRQLLPVLLQWFAEGTDPDSALLAFRRLSEDLGESHWYLRMLRDSSGAAQRMTTVLSNSKMAASLFEKIPEAAAWFEDENQLTPTAQSDLDAELEALLDRHPDSDSLASAVRQVRRRELLRVALGAVLGLLSIDQLSKALTELTESYLQVLLSAILRDAIFEGLDFAIIAMGRFGGCELGFGSDADVMFVYQSKSDEGQKQAEMVIAQLRKLSADAVAEFEIDIDLRPEGKNGAIARSLDSYQAYYERWSETWEAQALLRARPIAGSSHLRQQFTSLIDRYRYPQQLPEKAITEIRRIKARVETERLPQGADPKRHLKLGRGSLSDVEWLVQLFQLRFGSQHQEIQTPKTLAALDAMVECGLVEAHDARVLSEAWTLASRVRSASVLWANRRTDVLPADRRALEGLARILEYPAGSAARLEEDYLAHTRRARVVFERLFFA